MESSRWDLLNDMAEHRSTLKIDQNTYHARFGFTPQNRRGITQNGVLFLLW